jgi:hypothetical protein
MDLSRELEQMSWRRFTALLDGLSPRAMYRLLSQSGGRPRELKGAAAVDGFFARFPKAGE